MRRENDYVICRKEGSGNRSVMEKGGRLKRRCLDMARTDQGAGTARGKKYTKEQYGCECH